MHRRLATTAVCAAVVALFLRDLPARAQNTAEPDIENARADAEMADVAGQFVPPEVEFAPANRVGEGPQA